LRVMAGILGVLVVVALAVLIYLSCGLRQGAILAISNVDFSALPDGIYRGTYQGGRWTNTVEVAVLSGMIRSIRVIKDVQFQLDHVREQVLERIVEEQSTVVDAVSGATVTSKAYMKAVENALTPQE